MRPIECVETILATLLTGLVAVAVVFLSPNPLAAQEAENNLAQLRQANTQSPPTIPPGQRPVQRQLNESDRTAALESVHFALMELGDGSSYVWHRGNGKLSGVIQPTASFVDKKGNVCRHIVVLLSAGQRSKKTEAVACRQGDGIWRFDG